MFKTELDLARAFTPLSIAVLAVSDTRTLETDTAGALLKSMMEADGHRCAERAVCRDDIHEIRGHVMRWVNDPDIDAVITGDALATSEPRSHGERFIVISDLHDAVISAYPLYEEE